MWKFFYEGCNYLLLHNKLNNSTSSMGNTTLKKSKSLQRFFPNFKPEEWVPVQIPQNEMTIRYGESTTLKNVVTGFQIDRYELSFYSDREQKIYEECFMQRLCELYLVNSFYYQPLRTPGMCSTVKGAAVYIMNIPVRLCDIDDIPFEESLYMMKCSLLGFQRLFNESGYFEVMEEHIGICKLGSVKVWLNADLSKNYPFSFDEDTHQNKDYERIMVNQIIHLIQNNTNFQALNQDVVLNNQTHTKLSDFMHKNGYAQASFQQALQQLNQYSLKYRIKIPNRCLSVLQIFMEYNGQDQSFATCDEDFLDKIQVDDGEKQYIEIVQRQNNQRDGSDNMISSRTKNQNNPNVPNNVRPFSGEQNIQDGQLMQYKEYQPTSAYIPKNMRNSGMSGSAASVSSRNKEKIKLKSHRSSVEASRTDNNNLHQNYIQQNFVKNSNRNSRRSEKSRQSNQNLEVINLPNQRQNNGASSGLYGNKSEHSSNFYKQIGNDFQKICSDHSQNSKRSSQYIQPAQQVPYIQHTQQPLQNSNHSSKNLIQRPSVHSSQQIERSTNRQFVQVNEYNGELRGSNASSQRINNNLAGSQVSRSSNNSSKLIQRQNSPKISFNYINKSQRSQSQNNFQIQNNSVQNGRENHARNINPVKESDIDAQFRRDVQQVLSKINIRNDAFKKKPLEMPTRIQETDQQHEIDPQILQDIIKMQRKKQVF